MDFINTVDNDRPTPETLGSYADLVAWCEAVGLFTAAEAKRMRSAARANSPEARTQRDRAISLRELARRLFEARCAGDAPPRHELTELNRMILGIREARPLLAAGLGYSWAAAGDADLSAPLRALLDEIASFLVSADFHHLSRCEGPDCGWFFIDKTPSRRRRWCSMAGCGNRDKAHRHYERRRAAQ